jgi:hypothetical protein
MKDFLSIACFILVPLLTHFVLGSSWWLSLSVWVLGAVAIFLFQFKRPQAHLREDVKRLLPNEAIKL